MAVIVFTVGTSCLSRGSLLRALACWDFGWLGIAMLGTQTGAKSNPARQFGPAVVPSGHTDTFGSFLLAPMVGPR